MSICHPAQQIHQRHLLHRVAFHGQQVRAGDDDGQALGAGDGNVEAVFREQEADVAGQGFLARCGHGDDDHRGFLALEFVHRANPRAFRQGLTQQVVSGGSPARLGAQPRQTPGESTQVVSARLRPAGALDRSGEQYLVGVEHRGTSSERLKSEAVALGQIMQTLTDSQAANNLVFLDACREKLRGTDTRAIKPAYLSFPRSSVGPQFWTLQRPDLEQGHEPKPICHPGTG